MIFSATVSCASPTAFLVASASILEEILEVALLDNSPILPLMVRFGFVMVDFTLLKVALVLPFTELNKFLPEDKALLPTTFAF